MADDSRLRYCTLLYEAELCWLEQALKRVRNLPPLTPSKTLKLNE
jgi:hypothetical protein